MKQAIELDRKNSAYYFYLGDLLSKSSTKDSSDKGNTAQMIASYKEAYALNKYDYRAPFRLGMYYLPQRTVASVNYLLESLSLYPTNPNIESWLAVAYCYVEKDSAKASEHLSKAQEYNWGSLDLSFAEGVYELSRGNKALADKYFSTLSFYNDIYQKFGSPNNYSAGTYNVETTIIRDLEKELGN
jgi:tetratricopeptide (TPR) repeat protein